MPNYMLKSKMEYYLIYCQKHLRQCFVWNWGSVKVLDIVIWESMNNKENGLFMIHHLHKYYYELS